MLRLNIHVGLSSITRHDNKQKAFYYNMVSGVKNTVSRKADLKA